MAKKPEPFPMKPAAIFRGDSESERPALQPRAPGVYVDVPEAAYHSDEAFSNSRLRNLIVGPACFWSSTPWNPDREESEDETKAQLHGSARHKLILEGPDAFAKAYALAPKIGDHPGVLHRSDQLKAALKAVDPPQKVGGTNPELVERLKAAGHPGPFWVDVMAAWEIENAGKKKLDPKVLAQIELAAAICRNHPTVGELWQSGKPEVSIWWISRDGVPMRTRIDWWRPQTPTRSGIIDLKTMANSVRLPFHVAAARAIVGEYYHVQAVILREAVEAALQMPDDMWHGFTPEEVAAYKAGGVPDVEFLCIGNSAPDICQRILAPEVPIDYAHWPDGREVVGGPPREPSTLWKSAVNIYDQMRGRFRHGWETFGRSPWYDISPPIGLRDGAPGVGSFALSKDVELENN